MKKIVFYFHGYNSKPNTEKTQRLREVFPDTFAYDIDIDPEISVTKVSNQIFAELLNHINDEEAKIVFVGTSLGAWYAAKAAVAYGVKDCILINPCYDPRNMLRSYDVPEEILVKYHPLEFRPEHKFFIAKDDEVINFNPVLDKLVNMNVTWTDGGMHRYNGPEFEGVIDYIKNL